MEVTVHDWFGQWVIFVILGTRRAQTITSTSWWTPTVSLTNQLTDGISVLSLVINHGELHPYRHIQHLPSILYSLSPMHRLVVGRHEVSA